VDSPVVQIRSGCGYADADLALERVCGNPGCGLMSKFPPFSFAAEVSSRKHEADTFSDEIV
jgi:hypothetical protein